MPSCWKASRSTGTFATGGDPPRGPCDLELIANHVCLLNCPLQTYLRMVSPTLPTDTDNALHRLLLLRCSRTRLTDPSQFINRPGSGRRTSPPMKRWGTRTSSCSNGEFRRRNCCGASKAYSERRFDGNLAELLLSYGFRQPVRKDPSGAWRHFWKPRQVNPRRLKSLLGPGRLQGWLSPLPSVRFRVEGAEDPENFLDVFGNGDCASLDLPGLRLCERDCRAGRSIAARYRTQVWEIRGKWNENHVQTGKLWGV